MSRVRIFLVFAALAGLATVFAACGSSGGGSDEPPQDVLKDATFEGIESANLDASIGVDVSGDEGGNVDVEVSGPFQKQDGAQYPELDLTAKVSGSVNGNDLDKEAGLVLVPNKAFVSYEGESYEVDPTTFSFIESAINQAGENGETPTEASSACQEAAAELKVEDFVENFSNDGGADVGGTETTKVSGDLNVPGAFDQLLKLAEDPACSSALESAGPLQLAQLAKSKSEIEKALKGAHVEVYVGEDNIIRRVVAELSIEPEGSSEKVDLNIDIAFDEVNEEQEISIPSNAKPLNGLFQKLGVNPIELLEGIQSGQGLDLEGLLGGAAGGGGIDQGAIEECASQATSAADVQECVEVAKG